MAKIRVLIADDEMLVRRALSIFLENDEMTVVGNAENGLDAVEKARTLQPDVVVMDLQMPTMNGVEAIARITTQWPQIRVIAVTTFGTTDAVLPALRAGASGYLLKDTDPDDIVAAMRGIHAGNGVLSPQVTGKLIASIKHAPQPEVRGLAEHEEPTDRERETLEMLATGKSNAEIARAMNVSEGTVKAHLSSLMSKWNVRDRVQLLIRAARAGLVSFE